MTLAELCVVVLLAVQVLQTQAKLPFITYKIMLTMADLSEQRVCAIRSTLDERLKRSREWFDAERYADLRRKQSKSICAGLRKENVDERDYMGPCSGQISSTILMKMSGIFVCCVTHLTLCWSLLNHT